MIFELQSNHSIGRLHFGDKRQSVHEKLSEFEGDRVDGNLQLTQMPTEEYPAKGWTIHYTKYNTFGAMEFDLRSNVLFNGENIFDQNWEDFAKGLCALDSTSRMSADHIISNQFGISASKNETSNEIGRVCIFEKDFFTINKGLPHPSKMTSFHIQVAFVEDAVLSSKVYDTFQDAAAELFLATKEKGFILWNTIPISFDYREDLPIILEKIRSVLWEIYYAERGDLLYTVKTANLDFGWRIQWDKDDFQMDSVWRKVNGGLEACVGSDALRKISCSKEAFLSEWKMLLLQVVQAVRSKGLTFVDIESQDFIFQIESLLESIEHKGLFYAFPQDINSGEKRKRRITGVKRVILYGTVLIAGLAFWFVFTQKENNNPFDWIIKYPLLTIGIPIGLFFVLGIRLYLIRRD